MKNIIAKKFILFNVTTGAITQTKTGIILHEKPEVF